MARVVRRRGDPRRIPGLAYDAIADAQRRLADAAREAAAIREAASRDAAAIRDRAHAEGRAAAADEAARLIASAHATYDAALAAADGDVRRVLRLAVERAIRTELAEEPGHLRRIAADLLERARLAKAMRLRVHPDDVAVLGGLLDSFPAAARARIEPDERIDRGGCVLESDLGELDARIETQIERLRAILGEDR